MRGPGSPSPRPLPLPRDEEVPGPTAMELEAEPFPEPPVRAPSPEPTVLPPEETVSLWRRRSVRENPRKAGASGVLCAAGLKPSGSWLDRERECKVETKLLQSEIIPLKK